MRTLKLLAAASVAAALAGSQAQAATAWEFSSAGNSFTNGTWDFATAFTVNGALTVTGLGYYADPVSHNADGNPVAFYHCADAACDSTGTLLASTNVTNIYPLFGHFRYVTISPLALTVGDSYEVAGVSNRDNYTWADPGYAVDPAITLVPGLTGQNSRWQALGTPDFLTTSGSADLGSQDGYWGPNVFFGAPIFTGGGVPEPATWVMLIAGFGAVGFMMRARRNSAVTA